MGSDTVIFHPGFTAMGLGPTMIWVDWLNLQILWVVCRSLGRKIGRAMASQIMTWVVHLRCHLALLGSSVHRRPPGESMDTMVLVTRWEEER